MSYCKSCGAYMPDWARSARPAASPRLRRPNARQRRPPATPHPPRRAPRPRSRRTTGAGSTIIHIKRPATPDAPGRTRRAGGAAMTRVPSPMTQTSPVPGEAPLLTGERNLPAPGITPANTNTMPRRTSSSAPCVTSGRCSCSHGCSSPRAASCAIM